MNRLFEVAGQETEACLIAFITINLPDAMTMLITLPSNYIIIEKPKCDCV